MNEMFFGISILVKVCRNYWEIWAIKFIKVLEMPVVRENANVTMVKLLRMRIGTDLLHIG